MGCLASNCCDDCERSPIVHYTGVSTPIQTTVKRLVNCCSCLPHYACVSITDGVSTGEALFKMYCPPTPRPEEQQPIYSGSAIVVGTSVIDIEFHLVISAGECSICVKSTALGVTPSSSGACRLIDDAARAAPNLFCRLLAMDNLGYTEWTIGSYTIRLSRANHVAILNRRNCIDSYGRVVPDESPIRNLCCGCGCIAQCYCLAVYGESVGTFSELACLNDDIQWEFSNGMIIGLVRKANGKCAFRLIDSGNVTLASMPADIETGLGNLCPRPNARWAALSPGGTAIFIDMSPSSCGGVCTVDVPACCSNGRTQVPKELTAVVNFTSSICSALAVTVSLFYSSVDAVWIGYGTMYGHSFRLAIGCPFTTLTFAGTPCQPRTVTATSSSCAPISASFNFTTVGVGCCSSIGLDGLVTISVLISE